ncbi:MAG: dihydrolipoyl dehydrogenase [Anaerolineales bacterium]|nr:dihydrolipoyl dehydrogenase [Anaerolineales bacterium]
MPEYDLIVIGAGPGGYVCAIKASQLGKKTAIIDREWLGGVCLNIGCIPSKALLKNAEVAHILQHRGKDFGFKVTGIELDYGAAVKRSRQVSDRLVKGIEFLMKKNGIDVFMGQAKILDASTVAVEGVEGETQEIKAKDIVVATGARTMAIPGVELDGEQILSYREAILQETLPNSVVIVGAGPIGLEFATIWNAYGVEVTLVEMLSRIAPLEDEEVSKELAKAFGRRKIRILTNTRVEKIEKAEGKILVHVTSGDEADVIETEQALVAIGFQPNTDGLGFDSLELKLTDRGAVEVDERMATSVAGIWAIGDVTGKLMLAHVASAMGIICAENIAGVETVTMDYEMMPRGIYSHPQVASFGLTEEQAQERGYEVKVGRFPFMANGKALGIGERDGWVKLVTDARYGEILGGHMVGPEVTELLPELTLAQMMELTAAEIARNVHAHPSLSEVLMEAAHDVEGHAIHM